MYTKKYRHQGLYPFKAPGDVFMKAVEKSGKISYMRDKHYHTYNDTFLEVIEQLRYRTCVGVFCAMMED